MQKEALGTILAILTAVISGLAIPINKLFVVDLEPAVFTAVRALIIGIVFLVLAGVQCNFKFNKFKKVPWKYILAIAIVGGSFAFLLFFTGLNLTTAGRGAFIHKTLPLFATIFAVAFLKEKVTRKQFYALVIMFVGLLAIFYAKVSPAELWLNPSVGDLLILGATILWALENTIARKVMIKGESNLVVSFGRMFIGALILFGALVLMGNLNALLALTAQQVINLFISSAVLFGFVFCWYWSIKLINLSKASLFLLLAPVISLILGVLMFAEPVPIMQIAGSVLILIGASFVIGIKSRLSTGV